MNLGEPFLQSAYQIEEVFQRQIRVQPADDVKLRDRLGVARRGSLPGLFESHRVPGRVALLAPEGAQLACRDTDVGWIDVAIHVEVRNVPMHPLAHVVGQPPHRQNVR